MRRRSGKEDIEGKQQESSTLVRKIIEDKVYDTETSTLVLDLRRVEAGNYLHTIKLIYKTEKGAFFIHEEYEDYPYDEQLEVNVGPVIVNKISLLPHDEAKRLCRPYLTDELYEKFFGPFEQG